MSRVPRAVHLSLPAVIALGVAVSLPGNAQRAPGPEAVQPTTTVPALQFRYMGASPHGRIASAVGIPGDYSTYYLGAASGGLWKSIDGGHTYKPIFDQQNVAAIGTLAIPATDPNTIWVGTGEPWLIRPADVIGNGVYKSTDAGATWQHMGLAETGRIARIVVNPRDANNVFVCAIGRASSPQQERGVFRTTDGGKTWKRTLFVNPDTGCSGLTMDPSNPNTLFAGTWQVSQRTWQQNSYGAGSGIYVSHDNGVTWSRLQQGLPKSPYGKTDVAIAPSNPQRVYALIATYNQGSLWRSDDGGKQWNVVSWDRSLIGRAGYYIRLGVDPKNADNVYVSSSSQHYSVDGGRTFSGLGGKDVKSIGPARCGDCHDIWIDPTNPAHYIVTGDGGAGIATGAGTAIQVTLPIGQNYHVATDNRVPYWFYSNRQDDSTTTRGPMTLSLASGNGLLPEQDFMPVGKRPAPWWARNAEKFPVDKELLAKLPKPAPPPPGFALGPNGEPKTPPAGRPFGSSYDPPPHWEGNLGGCESGFTIPDPTDSDIVWASCYGGKLSVYDASQGTPHSVEPQRITLDSPPDEVKYRCHWSTPIAIDPFDGNNVYYGCQLVLKTSDKGHSWMEFSPDLSTKDPSRILSNGGQVGDNLQQYDGEVIWSMAFSPIQRGLLWAGTNDGKIWYTKDAESATQPHWVDVTANLHLPPWGQINQISPSNFDPGTAYIAVDFRMAGENDYKPYILKTSDYGATWKKITGDMPSDNPLGYVLSVAENPNKQGMLFAGTGHAFYYSMDDGAHWTHFNAGLPPAPVSWITVEPRFHEVVISTYGRGLFILPNITTLEQTGSATVAATAETAGKTRLFKPDKVFRLARGEFPTPLDITRPQFQFTLATAPKTPVKMEIFDSAGKKIRTQMLDAHKGLNGAYWDLKYDDPLKVELRTTPTDNPFIWEEPRFKATNIRGITHWGITPGTGIPLAAPGDYSVQFTLDGKTYREPFTVVKDPRIKATDEILQASTALQVRVSKLLAETSGLVNQMEIWRKQIQDRIAANRFSADAAQLQKLDAEILKVEHQLVSRESMMSDDKQFPTAYKVYMNLVWLSGGVGQGASDEAGGVDYAPTATQIRVTDEIQAELDKAKAGFEHLKTTVLPAFNNSSTGEKQPIKDTLQ